MEILRHEVQNLPEDGVQFLFAVRDYQDLLQLSPQWQPGGFIFQELVARKFIDADGRNLKPFRMEHDQPIVAPDGSQVISIVYKTSGTDNLPTVGEWYQGLPRWRQVLFDVLTRLIGDIPAMEWCGYWDHLNSSIEAQIRQTIRQ